MSICILFCHSIPANYEGRELKATKHRDTLDWNARPVKISAMEMSAMQFQKVLEILEGNFKLPSKSKDIKPADLCEVARKVDEFYCQAHRHYMESLEMACQKDLATIETWYSKYGECKNNAVPFAIVLGGLTGIAHIVSQFSPKIKAGAILAGYCAAGVIYLVDKGVEQCILRAGSTHRIKWMFHVDEKEQERFKLSRTTLNERIHTIQAQLQQLGQNETDAGLTRELAQLNLLKELFPEGAAS